MGENAKDISIFLKIGFICVLIMYILLIIFMSGLPVKPGTGTSIILEIINNLSHIPVYFILTVLIYTCFSIFFDLNYINKLILSVAISMIFGLFMELAQTRVPGRETSIMDLFLNLLGTSIGCYVIYKLRHRMLKQADTGGI